MDYKIRIDDYPWVCPDYDASATRQHFATMCRIFNEAKKSFLIGAIPAACSILSLEALGACLGEYGRVCIHGYDHSWRKLIEQNYDRQTWARYTVSDYAAGGEYANETYASIKAKYEDAHAMLTLALGKHYDPAHYICPFNCYNQPLLDALNDCGDVKYLHTCDKEYHGHGFDKLLHRSVAPVVATFQVDYDYARAIVERMRAGARYEYVTLHWAYDIQKDQHWEKHFAELAASI
jgi:hypothetical protein